MTAHDLILTGSAGGRTGLGGKAAALADLASADLPIPAWFALAPDALLVSLDTDRRAALLAATDSRAAHAALADVEPDGAVAGALAGALARLVPDGEFLAVRSSAADEDGAGSSFAGQLESYLSVPPSEVAARVADVWRSGFAERVYAYRAERGLDGPPDPPAVLVQRMVDADAAGVAFGADPISGDPGIAVVSAVAGLGDALVSGDADADTWRVNAAGQIVSAEIAAERQGIGPVLTDEQVRAVAALARAAGAHFGGPQDTEWAIAGGQLWLLQSRPITTLALPAQDTGELDIWDNSNIAESYNGVTTPLTFSFARHAYEGVYRELCRILGVSPKTIDANSAVFARMIGLVRGRIYYNLLSWYRVLALLPGYQFNRRFMEQMMGVRESLPDELVHAQKQAGSGARFLDLLRLVRTVLGLGVSHLTLPRRTRRFYARLASALEPRPLDQMTAPELAAYYRALEAELLPNWDAPLVNDFFAMVFFGLTGALAKRWCGDEHGTLQNDLLLSEGGMISAEPARRVRELAKAAADTPALIEALLTAEDAHLEAAIARTPAFRAAYDEYIDGFGDRCLEELKLESATLLDDPLPLLRSVGHLAARVRDGEALPEPGVSPLRETAEARVTAALSGHPIRRAVFDWTLAHARGRVRDRENLRFERTRLFGRVRRIFLGLGREFTTAGLLDGARDIFYLTVSETLACADDPLAGANLRATVAERRAEFDDYRAEPAPPDRFETRGGANAPVPPVPLETPDGDDARGLGCCPGVVRGRVRHIVDPRTDTLRRGEILVAERTDPGWVMLFPAASGILVERGSLLSHSAIVAREMGIPAVVAVTGLTRWLATGDLVEFDGATGVIRRLERAEGSHAE